MRKVNTGITYRGLTWVELFTGYDRMRWYFRTRSDAAHFLRAMRKAER